VCCANPVGVSAGHHRPPPSTAAAAHHGAHCQTTRLLRKQSSLLRAWCRSPSDSAVGYSRVKVTLTPSPKSPTAHCHDPHFVPCFVCCVRRFRSQINRGRLPWVPTGIARQKWCPAVAVVHFSVRTQLRCGHYAQQWQGRSLNHQPHTHDRIGSRADGK
jgi:hypothetical protein